MNALKSEKSELERRADRLGRWLFWFIFVIVAGLVAEYVPDLLGANGVVASAVRKIGEFLVIAGVTGELVIHSLQTRVETRIREINGAIGRKADRRIAKLKALAEQERLQRVQMERRIERRAINRNLTDEEIKALQETLKPFAGQRVSIPGSCWSVD
jgi:hypothetical protein